ncbi:heparinase II/III domain-containing protein [Sphingomonas sp. RS2018]
MKSLVWKHVLLAIVVVAATPTVAHASSARLAFSDANVDRLKRAIASDPVAAQRWNAQLMIAKAALANAPTADRRVDDSLKALALAYRVTGEAIYAAGARDLLLKRAARTSWLTDLPLTRRDPPWTSDLGMGYAAAAYGVAYDAIRDTLSAQERRTIVAGLVHGAIEPILNDWIDGRRRIHALDTMGHNWWGHIVFGGGVGVLSILRDDPRAAEWARRIDAASVEWFEFGGSRFESKPPTYGSDGAYSETIGYAELGLHSLLEFRRAYAEAFGKPASPIPALARTPNYFLAAAYPRSAGWVSLNFGDSRPPSCGCFTLADLWIMGDRNPAYLSYIDGFAGVEGKDAWGDAINLPFLPTPEERAKASVTDVSGAAIFRSQGLVTMRDGWRDDATMFALKSGFTWNHNHADAGSFILYHRGRTLLSDSGHSSYATPEYDAYYRQSVAHNVVTIDGKAEPQRDTYDGSHFMGAVDHLIDTPGFRYVWADATGPTARNFQRNFRNILWIGDTIVILDDVRSWDIGQYEWLLHYEGSAKRDGQVVRVTDGDASAAVRPLFPQPLPDGGLPTDYPEAMRLVEHQGLKDADPKVAQTYLGFQPAEKREREKFVVAIQPISPGRVPSRIERMEGANWIGVRITDEARVTEVYWNLLADGRIRHRNASTTLGGYDTDAYLLALSRPAGAAAGSRPDRIFVANGSYIRKSSEVLLDSLAKVFAHVDRTTGKVAISREGNASIRVACDRPVEVDGTRLACANGTATISRSM